MADIPQDIINAVNRFRDAIKNDVKVKKVFIFGSYANGNYTDDSDIDVCVIAEGIENNFLALWNIAPRILLADSRIEPVVFSYNDYLEDPSFGLLREIKEKGIEI